MKKGEELLFSSFSFKKKDPTVKTNSTYFLIMEDPEEGLVDAVSFYTHYHGHPLESLARLVRHFRSKNRRILWLVGDSSLDNKHWLFEEDKQATTLDLSQPLMGMKKC